MVLVLGYFMVKVLSILTPDFITNVNTCRWAGQRRQMQVSVLDLG